MIEPRDPYNTEDILDKKSQNLLRTLTDFNAFTLKDKSYFEVLAEGLESYKKYSGCKTVSFFLLDRKTFEFYFKLALPWESETSEKAEFQKLCDWHVVKGRIDVERLPVVYPCCFIKSSDPCASGVVEIIIVGVHSASTPDVCTVMNLRPAGVGVFKNFSVIVVHRIVAVVEIAHV